MTYTSVKKQSLGRVSHLGYLYDARSDSVLDFSVFNCDINPSALKKIDKPITDISYLICGSTGEMLQRLSVEKQLKLSVLSGLVSLDGSAKYLQTQNADLRTSSADLFYKITTVYEEVDIAKLSADEINKKCLQTDATHVVVGIKWGANVIVSFKYKAKDDELKQEIQGKLFFCFLKKQNETLLLLLTFISLETSKIK